MSATTIALRFHGYWRDINLANLPASSGIYCVYSCFNYPYSNAVLLNELFYIGLANDGCQRLTTHERKQDWMRRLRPGEELCYSFALIASPHRERAEAALIHRHKPWANDQYIDNFPFDRTAIFVSGNCAGLSLNFTLDRSELSGYDAALRRSTGYGIPTGDHAATDPTQTPSHASYSDACSAAAFLAANQPTGVYGGMPLTTVLSDLAYRSAYQMPPVLPPVHPASGYGAVVPTAAPSQASYESAYQTLAQLAGLYGKCGK
jgi:hypothetical protein